MRTKESVTASYMEEAGWTDGVYVVWLNGCTDGWPRAIFLEEELAENWVKTIKLNPEGYMIEFVNMSELSKEILKEWN